MIQFLDNAFCLETRQTSYFFRITRFGHVESVYYGAKITPQPQSLDSLLLKHTAAIGTSVAYSPADNLYCLDNLTLEYSGIGKGDYRHSPVEIRMPDGSFVCDFTYVSHRVFDGCAKAAALPLAYGEDADCQTLEITLQDTPSQVFVFLYYTVFHETDIITRRVVLENRNDHPLVIRKLMSLMIDLNLQSPLSLITLDGGWSKEANLHIRPLEQGLYVNDSTTGASSNRHNPGILIYERTATEDHGKVYGFNLVYSGNHYEAVEVGNHGLVRVMTGINPHCFEWGLGKDERFETPEAVMTFSEGGLNGASGQFHDFINRHIVRGGFKDKERPVLINNWEAHFFKFNQRKLVHLARQAKTLGVELFVLDDGWFGKRDSDTSGLGDYTVNPRKFRRGLAPFVRKINRLGMSFGLWFEPEMVNEDSDLFRAHPEYAVRLPGRPPSYGRNQLVLDLCNPAVRDYIVSNMRSILESTPISYVKWDMNRHMTDMYSPVLDLAAVKIREHPRSEPLASAQGKFFHQYILGLYDILTRIFGDRPDILLESCSSGGNRFDLGMLCFSPQIWASDDTDPVERLKIQTGLSYFYPLSTMGAHVSCAPHQQTLRNTPLSTRFHMACFGDLGFELDLKFLTHAEKKEIRQQIAFYKKHRRVFQYGRLYRFDKKKDNKSHLLCVSDDRTSAVAGLFQTLSTASESGDILPLRGLDPTKEYTLRTFPIGLSIKRFGELINHILPVKVHPDGFLVRIVDRFYRMTDCIEEYKSSGSQLHAGVRLNNQFMGSWYNNKTRLLGDYGSNLYIIEEIKPAMS